MVTIDHEKLNAALEAYKKYFPTNIGEEIYKWKAVKHFQDHWDIEAEDFGEMFFEATAKTVNLLTSVNRYPRGMVREFTKINQEKVRNMFRNLFDETRSLGSRVADFIHSSDELLQIFGADKMHYQDYNAITTYLWLRYPEKYFIYKYSIMKTVAERLGASFRIKKGADLSSITNSFELYDIIAKELVSAKEYRPMLNSVLTGDCDKDEALHTCTIDVGYFIAKYYQPAGAAASVSAPQDTKIWMYAPGEKGRMWQDCLEKGILSIGWDELGDLTEYESREDMAKYIQMTYGGDGSHKNDSLATWEFVNEMHAGDIVFAKKGRTTILGRGTVESEYQFDDSRSEYKHVRKIKWTDIGEWTAQDYTALKTLTEITQYKDYVSRLNTLLAGGVVPEEKCNYWWLCASPKIWSLAQWPVGDEQSYTLKNENGNKRRIYQNFLDAKAGDKVICYEANPTKKISSLAIISHEQNGEEIVFEKTETLSSPIGWAEFKDVPELQKMQFLENPNGSFFKLTKEEYNTVMDIIRESNGRRDINTQYPPFTKKDFMDQVFMSETSFERLKALLLQKKNIILQGAPGVGKTFSAERLAYAIMGEKDDSRVCTVQFHQNYSYEDFIMGYKPVQDGFELVPGIFYKFCVAAANDKDRNYFFIIDEINRGNLSKIFGELLMLIEKDYRNKPLTLAYKEEKFYVPENVYIIGMMNTADRSLAMIDYALRRRFSFFEMKPGFESAGFAAYQKGLNNAHFDALIEKVKLLNKAIASDDSLGEGFEIGHSYFCGQTTVTDEWLHQVIDYDLIPTLQEYWFDSKSDVNHWKGELNSIFND